MSTQNEFDRLLSTWLADEAPSREPEGLLPRTLFQVRRTHSQPAWLTVLRGTSIGRTAVPVSRLALILVLIALLALALLGGVLIGSRMREPVAVGPPSAAPTFGSSLAPVPGLPGRFAFVSDRDGDYDIYAMNPDRTELLQLTNAPGDDLTPLWAPDGSRIAFAANRGTDVDIYTINADGTGEARITGGPGEELLGAWSPDGTQIAYTDSSGTVHIVGADGSGDRTLTINTDGAYPNGLGVYGWLPAGQELLIVFDRSTEGGQLDIYRLGIADGRVVPLTSTPGDDGTPAVSPDGSRIAFESDRDGGCLYVMAADGSNVDRLTAGCSKGFPKAWAPDGSWIGWAGARRIDRDQSPDIQIIRPDASGRSRLTDSGDVFDLAWGPSH
jgi:dipeptidyl aminopeptidase/acylaminoacyl peptidase